MKVGDVYLLPYPFSDLSATKTRPAVVLAVGLYGDAVTVLVTSRNDINKSVELSAAAFSVGGLPVVSYVLPDRLFTASRKIIGKRVGRLTPTKLDEVRDGVIDVLRKGRFS